MPASGLTDKTVGADWHFRAVTAENWGDMAALFDGKGGPKTCWCMVWCRDVAGRTGQRRHIVRKSLLPQ